MQPELELSIVIVNWNTRDLLRDCLESIYATAGGLCIEVIVVDNASLDGSAQLVRESFPQVHMVENLENLGYARANNLAFPLCSFEHILLLNPDTRVRAGALQTLATFIAAHPEAGAIGPKIVHPQMRLRVLSCGYQPTPRTVFNQYFFLSSLFPHVTAFRGINLLMGAHDDRVRPVEWLSGACLLVRRAVIKKVGPFSETWFMYAEDMEWCQRMLSGGWALYHVPQAVIEHHLGASSEKNQAVSTMWVRSLRSYYRQRSQPSRLEQFLFDAALTGGLALRAVIYRLRALLGRQQRALWLSEADKFASYAAAASQAARSQAPGEAA